MEADVLTSSSSAPVTAGDVLGNRARSLQAPRGATGFRDLRPASRRRTSFVGTRLGSSLAQSCFLIEAQVQWVSHCHEYGGSGGVARID
jgi:hypothetical protein